MELDSFKQARTQEALARAGLQSALFSDFYNISYLTGYSMFFENGPSPFTRGAASVLFRSGEVTLVAEAPAENVSSEGWTGVTEYYQGYAYEAGPPPLENFANALANTVKQALPTSGKVGVEKSHLGAAAWEMLREIRPNVSWVELDPALMLQVRAVKSQAELEKLRACAGLAETGQQAVRRLVNEPGMMEIEVYSQAKAEMEKSISGRFALQNALHGGLNAASPFPGQPTDYVLQRGDLLISDMVPYLNGYWGDTCSTFVVGGEDAVTDDHRAVHDISRDAYLKGFEAVRPGITGGELDNLVRGYVKQYGYDYPHHTGHGLGVSNHEEPRIIIGNRTVLESGMVVVLEPAVYKIGFGGVRQERMILVTETGAEFLSHNPFELA